MGVACGDLDGDGRPTWSSPTSTASPRRSTGTSGGGCSPTGPADRAWRTATRYLLGFGTAFLDCDNDGRLDLMTANGHVNDNRPFYPYAMPAQLLRGRRRGPLDRRLAGRGRPLVRSPASAGAWPPATSTTTAASMP